MRNDEELKTIIEKGTCRDYDISLNMEWLETNGLEGYACGTVNGAHTRKYHSCLTILAGVKLGRINMLSKIEETALISGEEICLDTNNYPGAVHPQGYKLIKDFSHGLLPEWTYEIGKSHTLTKSMIMPDGLNCVIFKYRLYGPGPVSLRIRPLIAAKEYHSLAKENFVMSRDYNAQDGKLVIQPYFHVPKLIFIHEAEEITKCDTWYHNFEYLIEKSRGFDFLEDLYAPCDLTYMLHPGTDHYLTASTEVILPSAPEVLYSGELERRNKLINDDQEDNINLKSLKLAADKFIIKRNDDRPAIIAGYPWFTEWGRDTMISLPGLTLVTGRHEDARNILMAYAEYCDQGMLPNYFPDTGTSAEYNNIDASLWFFDAVYQYWKYTGDKYTVLELYPTLRTILTGYQGGTRYNIHEDTDGLITGSSPNIALTWMDARADDFPFTQREGKPVEINALWYNALVIAGLVAELADKPKEAALWQEKAFTTKKSFNQLFWSDENGYLYDCISPEGESDASLRPNQIFAVSLDHCMLSKTRQASVVETVMTKLLTPYGLRSLDPADERYQGNYRGDQWARDSAYHQGTVWGWLLGPFIKAYLRVKDKRPRAVKKAEEMLVPVWSHLKEAGLGNISEIFDGDFPHIPNGCFAQAWSVATIVQAYYEDILKRGPKSK